MLKIRLQRVGRAHEPVYRLVLTDSKNSTKSGKSLEVLGNYDSRRGDKSEFKADRISHWLSKGAQVSDTVHNLLVSKKVIEGKKINKLPLKKPILKDVPADAAPEESPKEETVTPASEAKEEEIKEPEVVETKEEAPSPEAEAVAEVTE
jgi:small subunit ribosomal protein S16